MIYGLRDSGVYASLLNCATDPVPANRCWMNEDWAVSDIDLETKAVCALENSRRLPLSTYQLEEGWNLIEKHQIRHRVGAM